MALTSSLAELAPATSDRLQDPTSIFWLYRYEVLAGLAEAVSELLLIVGRPTQTVNLPVTLAANTVWQPMPAGVLALTDIYVGSTRLKKTSLRALDYTLTSWTSAWESDRAAQPARWAPLGLNQFIVHPAPVQPIEVTVSGVAYPFTDAWPPTGAETTPFEKNIDQALQMYAASYARIKETGQDAQVGLSLYQAFLEIAQRYTAISDRRDDLLWTRAAGVPTAPSQVSRR